MIWFILFIGLILIEIILLIYLPLTLFKEILIIILGIAIGSIGFSFKDWFGYLKIKKNKQKEYISLCESFNDFFAKSLNFKITIPNNLSQEMSENEMLNIFIENNIPGASSEKLNSLKLCYYCKKWDKYQDALDFDNIKKIADSLGVKYSKLSNSALVFLKTYRNLVLEKNNLDFLQEKISEKDARLLLINFMNNYYKDLQFFDIREKFYQNKSLHETLVKIIQEGKLSSYGITNQTIERLQRDLGKKIKSSNIFLIITNATKEDKENLKEYLHKFSRFGMVGRSSKMPKARAFGVYILKDNQCKTPRELLEEIKTNVKFKSEAILRISPINFMEEQIYTFPLNQSFNNPNMKECYDVINWFKTGYNYSDSAIWSEISKSTITPNELLSVIPFNILCKGILPCEQDFLITNYPQIKKHFLVNNLSDWAEQKIDLLADFISDTGNPDYSFSEIKNILGVNEDNSNLDEKRKNRMKELSKMIINGAEEFNKSLKPIDLGGRR